MNDSIQTQREFNRAVTAALAHLYHTAVTGPATVAAGEPDAVHIVATADENFRHHLARLNAFAFPEDAANPAIVPDPSPAVLALLPAESAPYISIIFQDGPVREVGVNGCQVDDVIQVAIDRLRALNVPPHNNRETSLAITALEEAQNWLLRRTRDREERGVEGTSKQ